MQRDYIAKGLKVKEKTVFNFEELYKMMFRWFELYNYDFQEKEYRDSTEPNGAKHVEIRWYGERKIDDYIKFVIEVDFLVLGLQDVVIEKEGVKIKTNQATMEMRFSAYLLKDYEDNWSKTAFLQFLRAVYDKYIIRGRMESYEGEIHEELYKLIAEVKAFLSLHKFRAGF